MPGSGLKVCGGWVVSKPILVISLKPKSRLINCSQEKVSKLKKKKKGKLGLSWLTQTQVQPNMLALVYMGF